MYIIQFIIIFLTQIPVYKNNFAEFPGVLVNEVPV